jgi:hypothetical protein
MILGCVQRKRQESVKSDFRAGLLSAWSGRVGARSKQAVPSMILLRWLAPPALGPCSGLPTADPAWIEPPLVLKQEVLISKLTKHKIENHAERFPDACGGRLEVTARAGCRQNLAGRFLVRFS